MKNNDTPEKQRIIGDAQLASVDGFPLDRWAGTTKTTMI